MCATTRAGARAWGAVSGPRARGREPRDAGNDDTDGPLCARHGEHGAFSGEPPRENGTRSCCRRRIAGHGRQRGQQRAERRIPRRAWFRFVRRAWRRFARRPSLGHPLVAYAPHRLDGILGHTGGGELVSDAAHMLAHLRRIARGVPTPHALVDGIAVEHLARPLAE